VKLQIIRPGRWLPFKASVPGGPELTGTVRPLGRDELAAARAEAAKLSGKDREAFWTKLVAGCVLTWDAEDGGKPAPITPDTVGGLPEPYFTAIENHVTGYAVSAVAAVDEGKFFSAPA
jgi:hypothetical protein